MTDDTPNLFSVAGVRFDASTGTLTLKPDGTAMLSGGEGKKYGMETEREDTFPNPTRFRFRLIIDGLTVRRGEWQDAAAVALAQGLRAYDGLDTFPWMMLAGEVCELVGVGLQIRGVVRLVAKGTHNQYEVLAAQSKEDMGAHAVEVLSAKLWPERCQEVPAHLLGLWMNGTPAPYGMAGNWKEWLQRVRQSPSLAKSYSKTASMFLSPAAYDMVGSVSHPELGWARIIKTSPLPAPPEEAQRPEQD